MQSQREILKCREREGRDANLREICSKIFFNEVDYFSICRRSQRLGEHAIFENIKLNFVLLLELVFLFFQIKIDYRVSV